MGAARKTIESLIPGGPFIGGAIEAVIKHPERIIAGSVLTALFSAAAVGAWQGKFETSITTEVEVEVEDQGYGEIVDITLHIPEHPVNAYIADISGAKTVLSKTIEGKLLGMIDINIPAGTNWVTLEGRVHTEIRHDPSLMTAQYDPGKISDPTDDRIILLMPTDTLSVVNYIDPEREKPDFHGNWQNLGGNFATAFARSFDGLKNAPGVGTIDKGNNETEQTMLGITRVNMLHNVAETCSPKVLGNETVYKAFRENIINLAPLAIRDSTDPTLRELKDTMTVSELENMEVVLRIGEENDAQPFLPNQTFTIKNPYSERIETYKKNADIKLESAGKFECELSDDIKTLLNNTQKVEK